MRNIKLTIEYEGINYSGWQAQDNALGIQEVVEKAIANLTGERVNLIASGRTDAKVHAKGQVANFLTNSSIPAERFKYALNTKLPEDIKVLESQEVDLDFHARFDAIKKRYRYVIYNGEMPRPLYRNFSYHVDQPLDISKMEEAAKHLIGRKDFRSFMGPRTDVFTTIREIYSVDISKKDDLIEITIEGNSFLRNMVRIIVGTLVYVGLGKIKSQDIPKIIDGRDRTLAGPTAPPQGLFLEKVYYD
ncbi:MAG: tRNA pseudouridine(38-40) synthase TruA [Tissierellia bacterium]|nr:tRNA pseudouridine(38-40) synthase TruA [Tissierellia bacterium]